MWSFPDPEGLMRSIPLALLVTASTLALPAASSRAATTAFRFSQLALRDPHVYATLPYLGCSDITDGTLVNSLNNNLLSSITTDSDGDGLLDLSYVIVFDPLDQGAASGALAFGLADCSAPLAGTSCHPGGGPPLSTVTYVNGGSGTCLAPLAGTTRPYTPAVTSPGAPCFSSSEFTTNLDLGLGVPIPLSHVRIGATYADNPATSLTTGLLLGFLSQSDANAVVIPASQAVIGGMALAALLPGGTGNCTGHSDLDTADSVPGWWMYLNFTAAEVPFVDLTGVDGAEPAVVRTWAYPNPFARSLTLRYALERPGDVRVSVYDAQGRRVTDLVSGAQEAGAHLATWEPGRVTRPGVYFIRFESPAGVTAKRVLLMN
jgi:hypothetical protein